MKIKMQLLTFFVVFLVVTGVLCDLTVTGVIDRAAYVGHNVTLTCVIQKNGLDIFQNRNRLPDNFYVTWTQTLVNSKTSRILLGLEILPGSNSQIKHIADGIKYVNSPTDASLTISDLELSDAGVYTCSAKTKTVEKNDSADLFVLLQPECHNLKPNITYHHTAEANFNCVVHYHGNKPPLLLWKHDKEELGSKTSPCNDSCVASLLSFRADPKYNGYRFQCMVEYPSAKFIHVCETSPPLQVYFPVQLNKIDIDPGEGRYIHHVYNAGRNIKLNCRADGEPDPHYRWTFSPNGDNLTEEILATEPVYTIANSEERNTGIYKCTVVNTFNGKVHMDSRAIYVRINDEGETTRSYHYVIIQNGDTEEPTEEKSSSGISPWAIGAIICMILGIILILVLVIVGLKFRDQCFLMKMSKNSNNRMRGDHDENMDDQEIELLDDNGLSRTSTDEPQYGRLKLYWEIPRKDIRPIEQIATGSFVEVWKGKMRKSMESKEMQKVIIKKLIENATEQERKFFLGEMEVQKMLQPHPNVILLIGCYTFHEPWLLMLEYAQEGTLYRYLQHGFPGTQEVEVTSNSVRHKNINSHKLLAIAAQVVNGLMHLLKFKLIYYRLKSSNILVGRGGICKLSGFGFPHEIAERNEFEQDNLPVEWMSPESLTGNVYNYRTDIWSYGVLVWEIVHFGLTPYKELESQEIKDKITSGERLGRPSHCSEDLYNLMLECWHEDPMKRKEYPDILADLSNLATNHSYHIDLDNLPETCKYCHS